jgi:membrane fusion protein (multidrug efflux system)
MAMNKRRMILPILLLVLAGGLGGGFWYWWTTLRFIESTDDAYVAGDITAIAAKIPGRVVRVLVHDNQPVERGELLVALDDADARARLEIAGARVEEREAAVAVIDQQIAQAESAVEQAAAEVRWAAAEGERIERDYGRDKKLVEQKLIPTTRFDAIAAERQKIAATATRNRAALAAAEQSREVLRANRTAALAAVASARAEVALARIEVDDTMIRAPVAGVVGNRSVQEGEIVRAGAALLAVVPLETVWIEANFKETQIGAMRPGQRVAIEVDAYPELALEGEIHSLSPASGARFSLLPPENATGNFTKIVQRVPVRIALPAEILVQRLLRPGLSVVVTTDRRDAEALDAKAAAHDAGPTAAAGGR